MLTPTNIYVKEIVALLKEINVQGLAHITGGGLRNLLRLKKNVKFFINNPFPPNEIFTFLSKQGEIKPKEMYQTFNMGLGFVIVVKESDVDQTMKILKKYSHADVQLIGQIEKGEGLALPSENISYP